MQLQLKIKKIFKKIYICKQKTLAFVLIAQFDNTVVENAHECFTCARHHSEGVHLTVTASPGGLLKKKTYFQLLIEIFLVFLFASLNFKSGYFLQFDSEQMLSRVRTEPSSCGERKDIH